MLSFPKGDLPGQGGGISAKIQRLGWSIWREEEDMRSDGTARVMLDLLDQCEDCDSY